MCKGEAVNSRDLANNITSSYTVCYGYIYRVYNIWLLYMRPKKLKIKIKIKMPTEAQFGGVTSIKMGNSEPCEYLDS